MRTRGKFAVTQTDSGILLILKVRFVYLNTILRILRILPLAIGTAVCFEQPLAVGMLDDSRRHGGLNRRAKRGNFKVRNSNRDWWLALATWLRSCRWPVGAP